jgi:glycosyltransferase 2 family protein
MKRYLKPINLIWLLAVPLGYIAIRVLPWREIIQILRTLTAPELIAILALNGLILLLFGARWWLILRASGHTIPYVKLSAYRMAGFAISYFTPGTQFGGEPLQAYLVQSRHKVPTGTSVAAVTLDKLLELIANFTFLALGVLLIVGYGLIPGLTNPGLAAWIGVLLLVALSYPLVLFSGRLPLTALVQRVPDRVWFHPLLKKLSVLAAPTERQILVLFRKRPLLFLWALLISTLVWGLMLFEYWLMCYFLGAKLTALQAVAGLTATRVAFLTPLPGGVGLLEAGQALAMKAFGFPGALGISLSLLMRVRDLGVGLFGLWAGGLVGSGGAQKLVGQKIEASVQIMPAAGVEPETVRVLDRGL